MKYNPSIEIIMSFAARECISGNFSEIEPGHLLIGILKFSEIDRNSLMIFINEPKILDILYKDIESIKEILGDKKLDSQSLRRKIRSTLGDGGVPFQGRSLHRAVEAKRLFLQAEDIATAAGSDYVNASHLLMVILDNPPSKFKEIIGADAGETSAKPRKENDNQKIEKKGNLAPEDDSTIGHLTGFLKKLREQLREKIFGQDHAVYSFIEGLFNAEIVAGADELRRRPKGIFVFAGPPGVGKTYMAETAAKTIGLPFKRFDMISFSGSEDVNSLVGIHKSYKGAHPGLLTEFVKQNPGSILLFDEIEKAHLEIIHLFLQILDAGMIEDKFLEEKIEFKNTIIIFTTNAGKVLYEQGQLAHTVFHRNTILDALENETNPRTGKPFFPQAICSRMATGCPVMFKHLGIVELVKVAEAELRRTAGLFEKKYRVSIEFSSLVSLFLILREGINSDARTISSRAENFVKSEIFSFAQLFQHDKVDEIMKQTDKISFDLDPGEELSSQVKSMLAPDAPFKVLLVADDYLNELWEEQIPDIDWKTAQDIPDVLNILENEDIDLVLLDLWVNPLKSVHAGSTFFQKTTHEFDYTPAAARGLAFGQEILRQVHTQRPEVPCFLLSLLKGREKYQEIDDELFLSCARSGGVQGVIETSFFSKDIMDWESACKEFQTVLTNILQRIYREQKARELGKEQKNLLFDTAPRVNKEEKKIFIRIRNLRLSRAVAAGDISALLQDVEKPNLGFADVYGADAAKTELEFIVNYLQKKRQYKAMGLKPPKGILLYGPPGTGKTMLARALAGECQTSFINASATSFVTIWQGSGPQNVRDLFSRARKYAPSIIFIDEIDAIGKARTGGAGASAAAEQTLNALLSEMDGFENKSAAKPVIVLAATNLVESLDEALRRRFSREIEVDKPDRAARAAYLKRRLQGTKLKQVSDEVVHRIAGQSANMTIAELERIIELGGRMAADPDGVITDKIIEEAYERMRMGEARKTTDPDILLRVARHEAGHCLVGWLRGEKPVQITIVARGKAGGYVERQSDEEKMLLCKTELEARTRQAMAGRAAELLYYGNINGLTTGVSGDLQSATHYAGLMVRDYGMSEKIGQVAIDPGRLGDGPLAIKVMESVETIIKNQLELAVAELKENKKYLDKLVEQLMEKNRLTTEELEEILPEIK
jgi:ATP-dependent metalloprotease FtsH